MNINENIERIASGLPKGVKLIAVSKTKPIEDIQAAYDWGQRAFGENRPQEMASKYRILPKDIEWHMIGQLQEKNVKYIASFVHLVHSVDHLKLLSKLDKEAFKYGRCIDCLLEFHIAEELTKSGLTYEQAVEMLESEVYRTLRNVKITGVMGIATYTENTDQVRMEFRHLKQIFDRLKDRFFAEDRAFKEISMGMSGDYRIAIEEGCTMVRIGSSIFGSRLLKNKLI